MTIVTLTHGTRKEVYNTLTIVDIAYKQQPV